MASWKQLFPVCFDMFPGIMATGETIVFRYTDCTGVAGAAVNPF